MNKYKYENTLCKVLENIFLYEISKIRMFKKNKILCLNQLIST